MALDDELKHMHLNLKVGEEKRYVKHFNGEVLPLTSQVSWSVPRAATDTVYRLLHLCPELTIDRIHIGGSFGRHTLVRGAFDVDLSVFVNEYECLEPAGSRPGRKLTLGDWSGAAGERLQRDMQRDVAAWLRRSKVSTAVVEVEQGTHYKHCINVKVDGVDVDIKLVPNVVPSSQHTDRGKAQRDALMAALWATPAQERRADPVREAALAEALTGVVKETHDRVKKVVRLIKCWYKHGLQQRIPNVPSVLLEVLVLAAAQRAGLLEPASINRAVEVGVFLEALELLDDAVSWREVVVLEAGPEWGYTREQMESCAHVWRHDPVTVLHPIDPTCNLAAAEPGRPVDWEALASAARELMRVVQEESMWVLLHDSFLAPAVRAMKGVPAPSTGVSVGSATGRVQERGHSGDERAAEGGAVCGGWERQLQNLRAAKAPPAAAQRGGYQRGTTGAGAAESVPAAAGAHHLRRREPDYSPGGWTAGPQAPQGQSLLSAQSTWVAPALAAAAGLLLIGLGGSMAAGWSGGSRGRERPR